MMSDFETKPFRINNHNKLIGKNMSTTMGTYTIMEFEPKLVDCEGYYSKIWGFKKLIRYEVNIIHQFSFSKLKLIIDFEDYNISLWGDGVRIQHSPPILIRKRIEKSNFMTLDSFTDMLTEMLEEYNSTYNSNYASLPF
jgi:hypothetical protein